MSDLDTSEAHKAQVEKPRSRVVCTACPWFYYDAAMSVDALRTIGRQHERNVREARGER